MKQSRLGYFLLPPTTVPNTTPNQTPASSPANTGQAHYTRISSGECDSTGGQQAVFSTNSTGDDDSSEPASTGPASTNSASTHRDNDQNFSEVDNEPPAASDGFDVQLVMHVDDIDPPITNWLDSQLVRLAQIANIETGRVTLAIVDDDEMEPLHESYKKVVGTTDVLTFDLREYDDDPIEGDIVICIDEAARQASERGHTVREELLLYAVHGLLHLEGYDDHTDEDYKRMHQRENELLKAAGFAALFDQLD